MLFTGLWAIAAVPLCLLLLGLAQTGRGRLFACAALFAAAGPLTVYLAWRRGSAAWRLIGLTALAGWIGLGGGLALTAPPGEERPVSPTHHAYLDPTSHFNRHALGNLLPEVDQLMLGFALVPVLDPMMDQSEASQLRTWTAAVYRELEADPAFNALGSVLPLAYAELRGSNPQTPHAFVHVPRTLDRTKPAPVLVFFHGSGGNLKSYFWILSRLADRLGFVLVAPSFGLGNWRQPETGNRLDFALGAAARAAPVDRRQIHLAGLSNGGLAVSQILAAGGTPVRSFTFISPVFDERALHRLPEQARGIPLMIITGLQDDRVPVDYVRDYAAQLRRNGARVSLQVIDEADHFLMFSHSDRLLEEMELQLAPLLAPSGPLKPPPASGQNRSLP
jgi:pimeloyl-ACP methyl ester carboxylesterase